MVQNSNANHVIKHISAIREEKPVHQRNLKSAPAANLQQFLAAIASHHRHLLLLEKVQILAISAPQIQHQRIRRHLFEKLPHGSPLGVTRLREMGGNLVVDFINMFLFKRCRLAAHRVLLQSVDAVVKIHAFARRMTCLESGGKTEVLG